MGPHADPIVSARLVERCHHGSVGLPAGFGARLRTFDHRELWRGATDNGPSHWDGRWEIVDEVAPHLATDNNYSSTPPSLDVQRQIVTAALSRLDKWVAKTPP